MTLEVPFYCVVVLSVICYAILDGFDLGVGMLHLFTKNDTDRRIFLNAIGPVWDGNEVWLVIIGGSLFAGFPEAFATLFSTFYIPVMILLMGLIFRAVSIEFRSKRPSMRWRKNWDFLFSFGSFVIAFGVGVVLGNLIHGIPLENKVFVGTYSDFIHPFTLLVGVSAVALFMMHGSIFLVMKTTGKLHDKLRSWVPKCIWFFLTMYLITTFATLYDKHHMIEPFKRYPILFFIPLLAFGAILCIPLLMRKQKDFFSFLLSCISIAFLLSLAVIGTFPNMIRSTLDPATQSLTLYNSASSPLTLKILLIIVAIGVPLVLGYGFYIYRIFRGKVEIDASSY